MGFFPVINLNTKLKDAYSKPMLLIGSEAPT